MSRVRPVSYVDIRKAGAVPAFLVHSTSNIGRYRVADRVTRRSHRVRIVIPVSSLTRLYGAPGNLVASSHRCTGEVIPGAVGGNYPTFTVKGLFVKGRHHGNVNHPDPVLASVYSPGAKLPARGILPPLA